MEKDQKHPDRNHPTHPTQPNQQDDNTRRKGEEDRERETLRTTEKDKNGRENEDTQNPREEKGRN